MHGIAYTVLIALINSIDSLGAWIAFSIKGIKISNCFNLWIAFITFIISTVSAGIGLLLPGAMDNRICAWVSMALFVSMGLWCIAASSGSWKTRRRRTPTKTRTSTLKRPRCWA
jgi:putative Mn2+ efflux pump MntP